MTPLYIFDLDGTLALIEHRRHFVENGNKDWRSFYLACVEDKPNWPVIKTLQNLGKAYPDIWIFSGRSDEVRTETEQWLEAHDILFDWLEMRREGDYTPDDVLKKRWLDSMLEEDRKRLICVFDDRDRVVKMWRENGVPCFQVAPGGF